MSFWVVVPPVLCVTSMAFFVAWLAREGADGWFSRYRRYMESPAPDPSAARLLGYLPAAQLGLVGLLCAVAMVAASIGPVVAAAGIAAVPPLWVRRYYANRRSRLERQLDPWIASWAGAMTSTPNLAEGFRSLLGHVSSPWREEIERVIQETELGMSFDEALQRMGERLRMPELDAAISAVLVGKNTGGNLPEILGQVAASLREMNRLHGLVRTQTAEGRNQAWVIGAMPVVLIVLLQWMNPSWLEPLFTTPGGWMILAVAAVLETLAIVLVRKIMNVEM